jgi:hypothetical protein
MFGASVSCEPRTATSSGCSTRPAKSIIGDGASWRVTDSQKG